MKYRLTQDDKRVKELLGSWYNFDLYFGISNMPGIRWRKIVNIYDVELKQMRKLTVRSIMN